LSPESVDELPIVEFIWYRQITVVCNAPYNAAEFIEKHGVHQEWMITFSKAFGFDLLFRMLVKYGRPFFVQVINTRLATAGISVRRMPPAEISMMIELLQPVLQ
jgi:hypothetical protein